MGNNDKSESEKIEEQKKQEILRREVLEEQKKQEALKREIAEEKQLAAEAEKARLAAVMPSGTATPLEGKVTADDKFGYIADLTAYNAMMNMADDIACAVEKRLSEATSWTETDAKQQLIETMKDMMTRAIECEIAKQPRPDPEEITQAITAEIENVLADKTIKQELTQNIADEINRQQSPNLENLIGIVAAKVANVLSDATIKGIITKTIADELKRQPVLNAEEMASAIIVMIDRESALKNLITSARSAGVASQRTANLLIVDSLDLVGADAQLREISSQLEIWKNELQDQDKGLQILMAREEGAPGMMAEPVTIATGLAMVSGILSAVADIAGFFRIDYDVKGREIQLSSIALQARVAGQITKHTVHLPHFFRLASSPVIDDFNQCIRLRRHLVHTMAMVKSRLIDQSGTSSTRERAEAAIARSESVIKAFDEFNKLITSVAAGKDYSPLAVAAIRKYLDTLQITHLLYLAIASSGGDTITSRGLFQSGRVRFLGGGVVCYVLAESNGRIVAADTKTALSHVKFQLNQDSPAVINTLSEVAGSTPK